MLPADFARGRPQRFELPNGWGAIKARYAGLGPSPQLEWIFAHLSDQDATAALLEHEYLDRDYRDEYRQFYATTYPPLPDRCERLHFWAGNEYRGYCSIRPLVGRPVGRTMLDPGAGFEDDVSCVALTTATPYGLGLQVPSFPFVSQDGQFGRCAHAVIWMIARFHHHRFRAREYFMSDIVQAAAANESERLVPSRGLNDEQVGLIFHQLGLDPFVYDLRSPPVSEKSGITMQDVRRIVRCYMNSGMPLALGTPGHLTAIVGAGYSEEGKLTVVQCDDEQGVYHRQSLDLQDGYWELLWAPLPPRIYVDFSSIRPHVHKTLSDLASRHLNSDFGTSRRFRFREYLAESSEYKRRLRDRGLPDEVAEAHAQVPSARWVWVYELQDADLAATTSDCALGEIVVDATSYDARPQMLFANLPGVRASWRPGHCVPDVLPVAVVGDAAYATGTALNL